MATRISKSSVDWAKLAQQAGNYQQAHFNKFKGRNDYYVRKVNENPEKPPEIDFAAYRKKVANKAAIDALEKAYKSLSVPYPPDTLAAALEAQEKQVAINGKKLADFLSGKITEAEELMHKFKVMIPVDQMTPEEFARTFPDWAFPLVQAPSLSPHFEKAPGLSKKEREETIKTEYY